MSDSSFWQRFRFVFFISVESVSICYVKSRKFSHNKTSLNTPSYYVYLKYVYRIFRLTLWMSKMYTGKQTCVNIFCEQEAE